MSACKLLLYDIREGILKNKRFIIAPILALLQCMYADVNLIANKSYQEITQKTTVIELFAEIFHGCDPIAENPNPEIKIAIPYFWLAIFVFAVFIGFDYMHKDLTQFGIQILTRKRKRTAWWLSKCFWSILSGIWFFLLFLATVLIFSAINGYSFGLPENTLLLNIIADRSILMIYSGPEKVTLGLMVQIIVSPIIVLCTLNLLQSLLSLIMSPTYSYLIMVGFLVFGMLTDIPIAFTRLAMVTFSTDFYEEGYNAAAGMIICAGLIIVSIIIGAVYFKKYDILPDKE